MDSDSQKIDVDQLQRLKQLTNVYLASTGRCPIRDIRYRPTGFVDGRVDLIGVECRVRFTDGCVHDNEADAADYLESLVKAL